MQVKKASFRLAVFLGISYTLYIIGKMSFSAATVGLVESGVLTKTETGMINGIFWLVYAIGQIIGAIIVNKVSAYLLICRYIHICIFKTLIVLYREKKTIISIISTLSEIPDIISFLPWSVSFQCN